MSDHFDTLVVPAKEEGFEDTFLAQNCWYAVRIEQSKIDDIEYIAVYRTAPTSAITHFAQVKSIEPYNESDKYIIYFSEHARRLSSPIPGGDRLTHLQSTKYTTLADMLAAKTLDDL